jgi:hypothetical protein
VDTDRASARGYAKATRYVAARDHSAIGDLLELIVHQQVNGRTDRVRIEDSLHVVRLARPAQRGVELFAPLFGPHRRLAREDRTCVRMRGAG